MQKHFKKSLIVFTLFTLSFFFSLGSVEADEDTQIYGAFLGNDFYIDSCVPFLDTLATSTAVFMEEPVGAYTPALWPTWTQVHTAQFAQIENFTVSNDTTCSVM